MGEGADWLVRDCPAGADVDYGSAPTPIGNGEYLVSIIGRKVVRQLPLADVPAAVRQPRRLDAEAKRAAWERLDELLGHRGKVKDRFEDPKPELAYLTAPPHCHQRLMFPIHRFTFVEKVTDESQTNEPIVVEIPVYGEGIAAARWGWQCDPKATPDG